MRIDEERCTRDDPDRPRVLLARCGFCGRTDPHEHTVEEIKEMISPSGFKVNRQ